MRAFLCACCVAGLLWAQEIPLVKTEVLAIALQEPLENYSIRNGEGLSQLDASLTGLGPPIAYHGPALLSLMAPAAGPVVEGAPPPPPAAQVELPPDASRVLLVCVKREGQPLRLMAYDISGGRVHAGDYVFLHFAKKEVVVLLDEESFALAPGQIRVVSRPEWRKDSTDLLIRVGAKVGGENRLVFSSVWGHQPDRRNYVFLFDGEHASMPVVMRKVYDRAPSN